ncbi:SMAD/FHA domain-containing protein [Rhypophila decipiens]|uniref:SMAD/FHA domain-containing protein n=1 Tax=Rhypophila decipiens TaxID=261697 RepID=A0AAN7BC87_9PEZI|nr:SMAD/FHA domain-containing protein [Rhypophila decipiens]
MQEERGAQDDEKDHKRHSGQERRRRHRSQSRSQERRYRRRSRSPERKDRRSLSRDKFRERSVDESRDRRRRHREQSHDNKSSRTKDAEEVEINSRTAQSLVRHRGPLTSQDDSFAISKGEEPTKPVEKPNFGNTGTLAAASNAVIQADGTTVALKYHEPPEARKPSARESWKLFVFKGPEIIDTIELSLRSCWLIGRDMAVVDLPAEHPSISKQHAVIQFRYTEKRNEYGDKIGRVKPYLIDLESANGTCLNKKKVPDSRYLELRDKDMIQFGSSTREYVLMLAPKE